MAKSKIPSWLRRVWQFAAGADRRPPRRTLPNVMRGAVRQPLPKPTPANLRRFSETPVARKAINAIKDRITGMRWRIRVKDADPGAGRPDARVAVLRAALERPNADDSFRSLTEQVIEDLLVAGCGAIEAQLTPSPERPLALWPVDATTVRIYAAWSGAEDEPRYAQVTPWGERVDLRNDELVYIRLNPRTHTPFGLGRLEVAFETISWLLGAQDYAARLASNSVAQFALWLAEMPPASYDKVISWWQNEIEGTGKVPIIANLPARPEVLRFSEGSDRDLRLEWQRFLIRIIADAFDLPPLLLGLEQDVNRATADALVDEAFRTAVVPTARLFAEYPAPSSYTGELTVEELVTLAGQFRQGAREVLPSDAFALSVAAAQGHDTVSEMFAAAAGLVVGGQICRVRSFKPLDAGEETYAWQLLCDAPLKAD